MLMFSNTQPRTMETLLARSHASCCSRDRCSDLSSTFCAPRLSPSSIPHRHPNGLARPVLLVVRAGKGKRRFGPGAPQQRVPSLPKLEDDGNPKFVIFVRDKRVPLWFPLNIITGGNLAKMVVGAMGNEWGKKMAQGTLTRDLGNALYKDERTIRMTAIKSHPMLKNAKELEYGYKIVDMDDQRAAFMPSNVTKIPPQEELKTVADKVKDFFGENVSGIKETFKSLKFGDQESPSAPEDSKSN